jgi:exonuclease SbcC
MRLLSVNARNYRAIGEANLDFEGIRGAVIAGENGSGKSSIIEAILWCLYGESRSGRRADGVVRLGADTAEVTVTFQGADTRWKVKRTRSTKGRGKSTLDVWRDEAGVWAPQTGKNMDGGEGDSQAIIDRALGITFDTLINGPFMLQNDAARFCEAKPEDRREILRQILRLDEYRALQAQARAKAGTFETEAAAVRRELDRQGDTGAALATARDNVGWAEQVRLDAQAVVADCERLYEAARSRVVRLRVAQDDQHRLVTKRAELEADVTRYRQQLDAVEREVAALESTAAEWSAVEDAERKLPSVEAREAAAAALVSEAGANAERRRALEDRRAELGRAWKTAKNRYDEAETEARGLAVAEAMAATLDGEVNAAADRTAELAEERHARDELLRALVDIDSHPDVVGAREEAARFEGAVREAEDRADAAGVAFSLAIEASEKAKSAARRLWIDAAGTQAEIARLEKRTALLDEVPCAATSRWKNTETDDWAPECDLAGTCKLLEDARGAAAELAQARITLETQTAAAEAAQTAQRDAAEAAEAAEAERTEANSNVLAARRDAADAKAVADTVRDDLRAAYQKDVEIAERNVREAERNVREAEARVAEVRRVADTAAAKRAAAERAAASADEMALVEKTGTQIRDELAALPPAEEMAALQLALHSVRDELHSIRAITARREAVEAAKDQHGPALARKISTERHLADASLALAQCVLDPAIAEKMSQADNEQTQTETKLRTARAEASRAERAHATAEAEEERAEEIHEATHALRVEVEAKLAEARLWQQTGEALHLAAVVLIERAIPIIEAEANRVLAQVSSRGMRLTLETQRQNKTTDGVRETLDVLIEDNAGRRPYEDYSGGEQFRANLALRLGLARLLADREGVPIECVIIDEGGFGALDPTGIAAMKEVVAALQRQFALVLLVTHIPDVADCLPHLIRVEAGPNGSILRRVA